MNILITGGAGFIGSKITRTLAGGGHDAVVFDLVRGQHDLKNAAFERGSVESIHSLIRIINERRIDSIVHLAAILGGASEADPISASRVNVIGTLNVFEAARLCGVRRVVAASSMVVFGSDDEYAGPITDDAPRLGARRSPMYSAGKIYMEMSAGLYRERYGVNVVGLRPGIVYGPGRETGVTAFASQLITSAALGKPVKVSNGNAWVSMVYIDDVIDAFVALTVAPDTAFTRHQFFNTGGDRCKIREIVDAVKKVVPDAQIEVEPGDERDVMGHPSMLDDTGLRTEVGFQRKFTPIEVGVRACVEAVRSAP